MELDVRPVSAARFPCLPRGARGLTLCNLFLLGAVSVATLGCLGAGPRVGDGYDYYVMLFSVAESLTPYTTDRAGDVFEAYAATRPDWTGPRQYDRACPVTEHFWLYSWLAALFYWPLKGCGLDAGLSFNCLHVALLLVAARIVHRNLGPPAVLGLILLVIFSPLLWSINKAHTEFFTVMTATVGMAYFLVGQYPRSAAGFALAATQNLSFAPVALLALGFGFRRHGWKLIVGQCRPLALTAGLLVLHPLYFLMCQGQLTPKMAENELIFGSYLLPVKHMAAFWFDPDAGLLANWPLALPLLAIAAAPCLRRPGRLVTETVVFAALAIVGLTWSYTRLVGGFGGGGATIGVSRYAVWMLFLFLPVQWRVLTWMAVQRRALSWSVAGAWLLLGGLTSWLYWPSLAELSGRPSPVAGMLYANLPGLYDPVPLVFYDCYGGKYEYHKTTAGVTGVRTSWAVSDRSGNKILIWRDAMLREAPAKPSPVVGCAALAPELVYPLAQRWFAENSDAEFLYLNGMASRVGKGVRNRFFTRSSIGHTVPDTFSRPQ